MDTGSETPGHQHCIHSGPLWTMVGNTPSLTYWTVSSGDTCHPGHQYHQATLGAPWAPRLYIWRTSCLGTCCRHHQGISTASLPLLTDSHSPLRAMATLESSLAKVFSRQMMIVNVGTLQGRPLDQGTNTTVVEQIY